MSRADRGARKWYQLAPMAPSINHRGPIVRGLTTWPPSFDGDVIWRDDRAMREQMMRVTLQPLLHCDVTDLTGQCTADPVAREHASQEIIEQTRAEGHEWVFEQSRHLVP